MKTVTLADKFTLLEVLTAYLVRAQNSVYGIQSEEELGEIQSFVNQVQNILLEKIRFFSENDEIPEVDSKFFMALIDDQIEASETYKENFTDEQNALIAVYLDKLRTLKERIEPSLLV